MRKKKLENVFLTCISPGAEEKVSVAHNNVIGSHLGQNYRLHVHIYIYIWYNVASCNRSYLRLSYLASSVSMMFTNSCNLIFFLKIGVLYSIQIQV